MALKKFKKVEEGLERLLDNFEELKGENRDLKDSLGLKEKEIETLRERLSMLDGEKLLIKEKVESLLTRLDGLIRDV